MTDDNEISDFLQNVLETMPAAPLLIARELRLMAEGDGKYHRFAFISPWIKNIWNAAADIIEYNERQKLH